MPALAKNRSIGPKCSSACSIRATLPASVEMSATTPTARGCSSSATVDDAVEVGDDDAGAGGVEASGERGADAAGGAGDDDVAIVEVHRGDRRRSRVAINDGDRPDRPWRS